MTFSGAQRKRLRRRKRKAKRRDCPLCHQRLSHSDVNYDHIYPKHPPPGWPELEHPNSQRNL